jgi:hypothetical protein
LFAGFVSCTVGAEFGPVQEVPLTAKSMGARFWLDLLALKPNSAVAPAAIVRFQAAPRTLTVAPVWVCEPLHSSVIRWPSAKVQVRFQSGMAAAPSLRTATVAPNPVFHSLVTP